MAEALRVASSLTVGTGRAAAADGGVRIALGHHADDQRRVGAERSQCCKASYTLTMPRDDTDWWLWAAA